MRQVPTVAARLHRRRRQRRRGVTLATITCLVAVGALSAASALTGVGPLDDLLHARSAYEPVGQEPRVSIEQSDSHGHRWTMRAYRAGSGRFCIQAPPPATGVTSDGSCTPAPDLTSSLARSGTWSTVASPADAPDVHLLFGITRGDTSAITVTTRHATPAELSAVWTRLSDGTPIRAFLAVIGGPRPYDDNPLELDVTLEDGTVLTSTWPPGR